MKRDVILIQVLIELLTVVYMLCGCTGRSTNISSVDAAVDILDENLAEIDCHGFGKYYDGLEIIPLETTDASIFSDVAQVVTTDSAIYVRGEISGTSSAAIILKFDRKGKFLYEIGSCGEGPDEYAAVDAIVMRGDTLIVFDGAYKCIHAYSASTGEFIFRTPVDKIDAIQKMNSVIALPGENEYLMTANVMFGDNLYALGELNPIKNEFTDLLPSRFTVDGWVSYSGGYPTIAPVDDGRSLFVLPLDPVIYMYDYASKTIKPYFHVEKSGKIPAYEKGMEYTAAQNLAHERGLNSCYNLFYGGDVLIANLHVGSIVWNNAKGKGLYTLNGWNNKNAESLPFVPMYVAEATAEGVFTCAYPAELFIDMLSSPHVVSSFADSAELSSVTEEANPVLVRYRFKSTLGD